MRMKVQLTGDGKKPKREVEDAVGVPLGKGLTHVPTLLAEFFDYPRSTARMMIVKGNVSLNGVKLGIEDIDILEERLLGATLCCGRFSALLTGRHPEAVMRSARMNPLLEMAGI